jgi:endonuclease/exonuclease/phosphatase family metal-dependent hydrolase
MYACSAASSGCVVIEERSPPIREGDGTCYAAVLADGSDTAYGPLAAGRLRVLSWNLWWHHGPWEARLPAILDAVAALDPDVACFQEVWVDEATGDSLAARIAARLGGGFSHVESSRLVIEGVSFGNAVVSRWPITGSEVLDLPAPSTSEELRTCLRADVETPDGPVQLYSTHLNWRFDESAVRQEQVRAICAFVAAAPARTFPPVLCGDFNAAPDSDEIRMLTGRMAVPVEKLVFHDAWEVAGDPADRGTTWSNANPYACLDLEPDRRIDYVFVGWPKAGGRGHVESCSVVGTEPVDGVVPSDHYGVLATIRI